MALSSPGSGAGISSPPGIGGGAVEVSPWTEIDLSAADHTTDAQSKMTVNSALSVTLASGGTLDNDDRCLLRFGLTLPQTTGKLESVIVEIPLPATLPVEASAHTVLGVCLMDGASSGWPGASSTGQHAIIKTDSSGNEEIDAISYTALLTGGGEQYASHGAGDVFRATLLLGADSGISDGIMQYAHCAILDSSRNSKKFGAAGSINDVDCTSIDLCVWFGRTGTAEITWTLPSAIRYQITEYGS